MIDVEAVKISTKPKEIYPYVGIHLETGLIVLFTEPCKGTVLKRELPTDKQSGTYFEDWNNPNFVPYEGKLIIQNVT